MPAPYLTCGDLPVLRATIAIPFTGAWVAQLELDADPAEEAIDGAVTLADGRGVDLAGTVVRSGVVAGICRADVVAGAGGLSTVMEARSYRDVALKDVLSDILAAGGEALSSSSTPAVLATRLQFWTRAAERVGVALTTLADAAGARWRVLPDGTVWVGTETWPDAPEALAALELDRDDGAGTVELDVDTLALLPGMTLQDRHVGRVEYCLTRDDTLRVMHWVEA